MLMKALRSLSTMDDLGKNMRSAQKLIPVNDRDVFCNNAQLDEVLPVVHLFMVVQELHCSEVERDVRHSAFCRDHRQEIPPMAQGLIHVLLGDVDRLHVFVAH